MFKFFKENRDPKPVQILNGEIESQEFYKIAIIMDEGLESNIEHLNEKLQVSNGFVRVISGDGDNSPLIRIIDNSFKRINRDSYEWEYFDGTNYGRLHLHDHGFFNWNFYNPPAKFPFMALATRKN